MKTNHIAIGLAICACSLGSQAQTTTPLAVNPVVLPAPAPAVPPSTIKPVETSKPVGRVAKPAARPAGKQGKGAGPSSNVKIARSGPPAKARQGGRPARPDRVKPGGKKQR